MYLKNDNNWYLKQYMRWGLLLVSSYLVPFLPLEFVMGIDGAPAKFTGAPRGIPQTANPPTQQHYWGRKGGYGFNVCIVKNFF